MPTDYIDRGKKEPSPLGSTLFVGLRALDPYLQHSILIGRLGHQVVTSLGSNVFAMGPTSNTGYALIDALHLSPYRLVLLAMATGSAAKQIFWQMAVAREAMPPQSAIGVSLFNSVFNSLNSLVFIASATSAGYGRGEGPGWEGYPGGPLKVGGTLFVVGMLLETISEVQRSFFKQKEGNENRVFTGGLFAYARHINYGGYTLWRTGMAIASGGFLWGLANFGFFFYDFTRRAIPVLDEYADTKYVDSWHDYKKQTKSVLFPWIY